MLLAVTAVAKSIGDFKAHLYAAWHSGRKSNNPISREVQESITSVPERTQRHYSKVAKIKRQTNIAIGSKYSKEEVQKQAWQRGQATFKFTDHRGKLGREGKRYIAWHLPNSYSGPHQQATPGRMRKINRKLQDLVNKGTQGNEQQKIEKLYHPNGAAIGRALNNRTNNELYWLSNQEMRGFNLWHCFCVQ